jgi:hypothetical protein
MAVDIGFESHLRRRIFSKEGTSVGPWMCVHVFQGLTVGWWKEEKHYSDHHREVGRVRIPAGWATHGCCVVCVLCLCCEKGVERVGVGGRGKYPGAPPHHLKKELADRKDQVVKGEGCREKKKSSSIRNCFGIHDDVQNRQQLNTVV